MKELTETDSYEIVEATLTIQNSLDVLYDFCLYNESNHKLTSVSRIIEMLQKECAKILDKF